MEINAFIKQLTQTARRRLRGLPPDEGDMYVGEIERLVDEYESFPSEIQRETFLRRMLLEERLPVEYLLGRRRAERESIDTLRRDGAKRSQSATRRQEKRSRMAPTSAAAAEVVGPSRAEALMAAHRYEKARYTAPSPEPPAAASTDGLDFNFDHNEALPPIGQDFRPPESPIGKRNRWYRPRSLKVAADSLDAGLPVLHPAVQPQRRLNSLELKMERMKEANGQFSNHERFSSTNFVPPVETFNGYGEALRTGDRDRIGDLLTLHEKVSSGAIHPSRIPVPPLPAVVAEAAFIPSTDPDDLRFGIVAERTAADDAVAEEAAPRDPDDLRFSIVAERTARDGAVAGAAFIPPRNPDDLRFGIVAERTAGDGAVLAEAAYSSDYQPLEPGQAEMFAGEAFRGRGFRLSPGLTARQREKIVLGLDVLKPAFYENLPEHLHADLEHFLLNLDTEYRPETNSTHASPLYEINLKTPAQFYEYLKQQRRRVNTGKKGKGKKMGGKTRRRRRTRRRFMYIR